MIFYKFLDFVINLLSEVTENISIIIWNRSEIQFGTNFLYGEKILPLKSEGGKFLRSLIQNKRVLVCYPRNGFNKSVPMSLLEILMDEIYS